MAMAMASQLPVVSRRNENKTPRGEMVAVKSLIYEQQGCHRSSEELGGFVNAEQAGSKRPIVCCPCRFGVCWNPTCIWMSWGESGQPTCPTISGGDCIDGIAVIPS